MPDESIAEYVAELRRLSTHCKFDGYLEDELCDQLVCELRNDNIREKLFVEAPELQNVQELRSFFGLLSYYAKSILNLARYCTPVMLVKLNVNLRAMQTIVMVLKTRSQVKCRNQVNHRNLNLYNAILNELVDPQTCMVINLRTIILCSLM